MENKKLENKVFEALGEVSMCWSETPKGVFDSSNAERIGSELMKEIKDDLPNAINVLQKYLREDEDYYNRFIVNLGKYFIDEYKITEDKYKISEIAFKAAKNFLDNIINEE